MVITDFHLGDCEADAMDLPDALREAQAARWPSSS
jgi:hypothetical protein